MSLEELSQISNIIIAISTTIGAIGVFVAWYSLKSNHDWNRRQLAIDKISTILKELREYRTNEFETLLHYSNRKKDDAFKVKELHLLMCEKDENGNLKWNNDKHCILTPKGRILANQIQEVLNSYEIISTGVFENTFDEEIVKKLMKGNLDKAFYIFKDYIIHLREHYKRNAIYENLEKLVKKWESEHIKVEKRNPTA